MSNPNLEVKVKDLLDLKRMKEELEAEISAAEDEIKHPFLFRRKNFTPKNFYKYC